MIEQVDTEIRVERLTKLKKLMEAVRDDDTKHFDWSDWGSQYITEESKSEKLAMEAKESNEQRDTAEEHGLCMAEVGNDAAVAGLTEDYIEEAKEKGYITTDKEGVLLDAPEWCGTSCCVLGWMAQDPQFVADGWNIQWYGQSGKRMASVRRTTEWESDLSDSVATLEYFGLEDSEMRRLIYGQGDIHAAIETIDGLIEDS